MKDKKKQRIKVKIGCVLISAVLFAACGEAGVKEQMQTPDVSDAEEVKKAADVSGTEVKLEDFSMPVKEKPDGEEFANVAVAAEQIGYDFVAVEKFSNGYEFTWLTVMDNIMELTYQNGDKKIVITIMPPEEETEPHNETLEPMQIGENEVQVGRYIHLEMPVNWEEIITEEEQEFLNKGLASGGVDNYISEIIRHDFYWFLWQQDGQKYVVNNEACFGVEGEDPTREDMEILTTEWIAANADVEETE